MNGNISPEPGERENTIRKSIVKVLKDAPEPLAAKDISALVGVSEKEVYTHLEHIKKSGRHSGDVLKVKPAECKKCGYSFAKRDRLDKPGKCPSCREQRIQEALFIIK
jgi:predicted Zn-ribbon and HTH transcriptional regulator